MINYDLLHCSAETALPRFISLLIEGGPLGYNHRQRRLKKATERGSQREGKGGRAGDRLPRVPLFTINEKNR